MEAAAGPPSDGACWAVTGQNGPPVSEKMYQGGRDPCTMREKQVKLGHGRVGAEPWRLCNSPHLLDTQTGCPRSTQGFELARRQPGGQQ